MYTYLLVAGAAQDVKNPIMNKTNPYMNAEDGSSGNSTSKIPVKGMAEAVHICDRIVLPVLGKRFARISPIHPPNRPPSETPITRMVERNAVFSCEKPTSSNHIGANDQAAPANDPETP